jgi:hypothetical protein
MLTLICIFDGVPDIEVGQNWEYVNLVTFRVPISDTVRGTLTLTFDGNAVWVIDLEDGSVGGDWTAGLDITEDVSQTFITAKMTICRFGVYQLNLHIDGADAIIGRWIVNRPAIGTIRVTVPNEWTCSGPQDVTITDIYNGVDLRIEVQPPDDNAWYPFGNPPMWYVTEQVIDDFSISSPYVIQIIMDAALSGGKYRIVEVTQNNPIATEDIIIKFVDDQIARMSYFQQAPQKIVDPESTLATIFDPSDGATAATYVSEERPDRVYLPASKNYIISPVKERFLIN